MQICNNLAAEIDIIHKKPFGEGNKLVKGFR
jgi:hypothetical protein